MTATLDRPTATLMPTGRYEWERIVRRVVMPPQHKLVALLLATWADPDGSRVRPGMDLIAAAMGRSRRTASEVVRSLCREFGLLEQVARGGGRGRAARTAEYRLVIPTDLLDRQALLDPDGRPNRPATQASCQSDDSSATQASDQSEPDPVDNSDPSATLASDQSCQGDLIDRKSDAVTDRLIGNSERLIGNPALPTTTHVTKPPKETNTPTGLPTQPPTAREPPDERPISSAKCERHPLLAGGRDPGGRPRCPICRRVPEPGAST